MRVLRFTYDWCILFVLLLMERTETWTNVCHLPRRHLRSLSLSLSRLLSHPHPFSFFGSITPAEKEGEKVQLTTEGKQKEKEKRKRSNANCSRIEWLIKLSDRCSLSSGEFTFGRVEAEERNFNRNMDQSVSGKRTSRWSSIRRGSICDLICSVR